MTALRFGSIGTIVDTSELQRQSFNQAFTEHGLGWTWDRDDYVKMLETSGGSARIARFAQDRNEEVDAEAVHASKSEFFQRAMDGAQLESRAGVSDAIRRAKDQDMSVALVTTTSSANVASMVGSVDVDDVDVDVADFDLLLSSSDVDRVKPDSAVYVMAMDQLGLSAAECIAVEDNVDGVTAATTAGLMCVVFPNANTAGHDFNGAEMVDTVDFDHLLANVEPG